MLDKILTGENVKVNGEIVGRRHILRTLLGTSANQKRHYLKSYNNIYD
jgi:hypothetical protein